MRLVRLRAAQRAADSAGARSSRRPRHGHAHRRAGHADRHRRHRQSPRRDDQHARQRRRQPRRAPGLRARPAKLGDGEPLGRRSRGRSRIRWSAARSRSRTAASGGSRSPHALEKIDGAAALRLARRHTRRADRSSLAAAPCTFGGRIDKEGYRPGRLDVTMSGRDMRLRFPEGMRSLVDADLTLQGTAESAVLSGLVTVKDAVYTRGVHHRRKPLRFQSGSDRSRQPRATTETLPGPAGCPRQRAVHAAGARTARCAWSRTPTCKLRGTIEQTRAARDARRSIAARRCSTGSATSSRAARWTSTIPTRIEPFLDIEAETRIRVPQETYRVTLRVTGPLAQPNFSFNSDPPLGEVEILALVFSDVSPGGNAEFRQFDELTPQAAAVPRARGAGADRRAVSRKSVASSSRHSAWTRSRSRRRCRIPTRSRRRPHSIPGMRLTVLKRLSERLYLTYSRSLSSSSRDTQVILLEFDQIGSALLDPVAQ